MANPEFFKKEFDNHAINGFIGDPDGEPSYGYLRVSSKGQAEEGRSGLPRQIENIHEKALKEHLKISWDMIFADDHTGFEFEDRPQLKLLIRELKSPTRRASAIVFENIDRLSRNAEWHQGYLYELLSKKLKAKVVFFKDPGNRITRMVLGVVAQDGMEDAKERMRIGQLKKMQDGRIGAKHPAYGYQFVDSKGDPNGKVKRDTHYGIYEPEAQVVRWIFEHILAGESLRKLMNQLNILYPPPKRSKTWDVQTISRIVRNTVYKGIWIGNKTKTIKVEQTKGKGKLTGETPKLKKATILRPEEEWINVPVPAIISEIDWEYANNILTQNAVMAQRNGKREYLLTGLIKCATCGLSYCGKVVHTRNRPGGKKYSTTFYYCSSKVKSKLIRATINCKQSMIPAAKIENKVWNIVYTLMSDPNPFLIALENIYRGESNESVNSQVRHIEDQLEVCNLEDARVKKGYNSGVYSEEEAIEERTLIKNKRQELEKTLSILRGRQMTLDQLEAQKNRILNISRSFKEQQLDENTSFALKKTVIKTAIKQIILDVENQSFEITGMINGTWHFDNPEKKGNEDNGSSNNDSADDDQPIIPLTGGKINIVSHSIRKQLPNVDWSVKFTYYNPTNILLSVSSLGGNITSFTSIVSII